MPAALDPLERIRTHLPRTEVLLGWLVVAHVVLKVLLFPLVMNSPPHGDEQAYLNGGMALSNTLRDLGGFTTPDWAELDRNLVASGWFMPGMSIVVSPLYLVFPDAGPGLVRGYIGLFSLILFVAVLRHVARTLGHRWAIVLAVFPGLVPMYVVFTYGAWGDLYAGLFLVLVVLRLIEMFRGLRQGRPPTVRDGVMLGLLSIVTLYLRSSTSILLAGLGIVTLLAALIMLRGRARWRAVGSAGIAGVLFLVLLAPWSVYASEVLGGRVITTTTLPTVEANTFGDRDLVCFGECDPGSTLWFRPLRYAREVGRATDTSEVDVLKAMSSYALHDVTLGGYLDQVDHNLAAYSLQPAIFIHHLEPADGRSAVGSVGAWLVKLSTWLLYFPVLLLVAASLVTVARRSLEARLLDILVKLCLGALLVQPFVHIAGGRYWTTAGPFFGIAAAIFLRERLGRISPSHGGAERGPGGALAALPTLDRRPGMPSRRRLAIAPPGRRRHPPGMGRHGLVRSGRAAPPPDGVATAADATIVTWLARVQVLLAAATALVAVVLAAAVALPPYPW